MMEVAKQDQRFSAIEVASMVLLAAIFFLSAYFYVSDFPILRRYLFGLETSAGLAEIGRLKMSSGKVRRQRANQAEFENISENAPLYNLDTVVTGSDVRAQIKLDDGGVLDLAPSTMVKLAFSSKFSLSGVTRQANVELVSGSVSGEAKKENIVVTTRTGTRTSFKDSPKLVIQEKVAAPKKIELPVSPVVNPVPAPAPSLIVTRPEPSPSVEAPPPKPVPITVSGAYPAPGEALSVPDGSTRPIREITLSWRSSAAGVPVRLRVYLRESGANQRRQVLDTETKSRLGSNPVRLTLKKPGNYSWEVVDLTAQTTVLSSDFSLKPEYEAIQLQNVLVGGKDTRSSEVKDKVIKDFGGITLRWVPYNEARRYTVAVYRDPQAPRPEVTREVDSPEFTINKNKVSSGRLFYRVSTLLPSGFKVSSRMDTFEFTFAPPGLVLPVGGARISSASAQSVLFTWKKTNYTQAYEIELARDPAFNSIALKQRVKDNFHPIPMPEPGLYYWRVRSISETSMSPPSPANSLQVR